MNDLTFYIDRAREQQNFRSNRELCRALGVTHSAITSYQNGSLPTDENMIKLAEFAGISPEQALIDLNTWRAPNDRCKMLYMKMGDMLRQAAMTAAAILVFISCTASPTLAHSVSSVGENNIYYGK